MFGSDTLTYFTWKGVHYAHAQHRTLQSFRIHCTTYTLVHALRVRLVSPVRFGLTALYGLFTQGYILVNVDNVAHITNTMLLCISLVRVYVVCNEYVQGLLFVYVIRGYYPVLQPRVGTDHHYA